MPAANAQLRGVRDTADLHRGWAEVHSGPVFVAVVGDTVAKDAEAVGAPAPDRAAGEKRASKVVLALT
jgi:hypothetical protein